MATFNASVFGLKDSSLIKTQGLIYGKWVDAKDGSTFQVTSESPDTLYYCEKLIVSTSRPGNARGAGNRAGYGSRGDQGSHRRCCESFPFMECDHTQSERAFLAFEKRSDLMFSTNKDCSTNCIISWLSTTMIFLD